MLQTNALQIQEDLKKQKFVTVPQLQQDYALTYSEAKEFLRLLILRGWVEPQGKGLQYNVQKKKLCLRKLQRQEVDGLIADITSDCIRALECLVDNAGLGATANDLEIAVRGDDDTQAAIRILTKHKLIFQNEEWYFLTVSEQTVKVLGRVDSEKRRSVLQRKLGSKDKEAELKKLFDPLFED
jgi:hypothetical protein